MRVVFIGTGEIGVPTLQALLKSEHKLVGVVTQPDKPAGRDQRLQPPAIKKALENDGPGGRALPILQPERIKDRDAVEKIRALEPEIIVVAAYGQILPRQVLEIPKIACLNVHASLLPHWRGAAPIQAAISRGDQQTGITIMYMDEGLDTGDILLQAEIDILPNDTGGSLHDRLAKIAPPPLLESLRLLQGGTAPRMPQDNSVASYAPKLKREDGLIDWDQSAAEIERKIRAFNPWPGAFVKIDDRNLKIFAAQIVDMTGRPGDFLRTADDLVVAAGRGGALSLTEVQPEGKRRMSAAEFLRGRPRLSPT